jgi:hypothetical protein
MILIILSNLVIGKRDNIMATKKKLGNALKIGDRFVLPRETVEIIGQADLPYVVVSEDKGSVYAFQVKQTSGPLKGNTFSVMVLGDGKVEYVLKDPVLTRFSSWLKAQVKDIFTPAKKQPEPKPVAVRIDPAPTPGPMGKGKAKYTNGHASP